MRLFKRHYIFVLLFVCGFLSAAMAVRAELPPAVQLDKYQKLVEQALDQDDCQTVLNDINQIDKLSAKLTIKLIYHRGRCRLKLGHYSKAMQSLENFLSTVPHNHPLYDQALALYAQAEAGRKRAEQEKEKEAERRKAETDRRRLEDEKRDRLLQSLQFVFIRGGCFQMGCVSRSKECIEEEKPVHEVCVDDFWMGKFEVTNAQYRVFRPKHSSRYFKKLSLNGANQPVVFVSWDDVRVFLDWLNPSGQHRKFRLPTEAEWEYACRAGTTTTRFWGNNSNDACAYANVADFSAKKEWLNWTPYNCDDGFTVTSPVGTFQPNGWGLYDMLGNVYEWCADIYAMDAYLTHDRRNPRCDVKGDQHVCRGGSWDGNTRDVRSANRYGQPAGRRSDNLGFRIVMVKE